MGIISWSGGGWTDRSFFVPGHPAPIRREEDEEMRNEWLTADVVAIARGVVAEGLPAAWGSRAIGPLADALEEAGCDDTECLGILRGRVWPGLGLGYGIAQRIVDAAAAIASRGRKVIPVPPSHHPVTGRPFPWAATV
jgi:hypothetical protein